MIDWFVLLTPLLLLPIFLLFVFVGCAEPLVIPVLFGRPGDIPVPGNYFGDNVARAAFFRPATQEWHIFQGDIFAYEKDPTHLPGSSTVVTFPLNGSPTDIPVPGDYDGNGLTRPAVFRPLLGTWEIGDLQGTFSSSVKIPFPLMTGDIALPPGDYLGDGGRLLAIFRPTTRQWWIMAQDQSGTLVPLPPPFSQPVIFPSFSPAVGIDTPVPGDYLGVGRTQIAVFRRADNAWLFQDLSRNITRRVRVDPRVLPGDILPPQRYEGLGGGRAVVSYQAFDFQEGGDHVAAYYLLDPQEGILRQRVNVVSPSAPDDLAAPAGYDSLNTIEEVVFRPTEGTWIRPDFLT